MQFSYGANVTLVVVSTFGLVGNIMSFIVLIRRLKPKVGFVSELGTLGRTI